MISIFLGSKILVRRWWSIRTFGFSRVILKGKLLFSMGLVTREFIAMFHLKFLSSKGF